MNTTLEHTHTTENSAPLPSESPATDAAPPAKTPSEGTRYTAARPAVMPPPPAKPMDRGRFAIGLLLSSAGITLLLFVAVGMLQQIGLNGWFSLPLVALTAIFGVMMLGGGFGLMATAAAGLDDGEFERLMEAGNISSVTDDAIPLPSVQPEESDPSRTTEDDGIADDGMADADSGD